MKTKFLFLILSICFAFITAGCNNDLQYKEPEVTAVTQLLSPNQQQHVTLVPSATAG